MWCQQQCTRLHYDSHCRKSWISCIYQEMYSKLMHITELISCKLLEICSVMYFLHNSLGAMCTKSYFYCSEPWKQWILQCHVLTDNQNLITLSHETHSQNRASLINTDYVDLLINRSKVPRVSNNIDIGISLIYFC